MKDAFFENSLLPVKIKDTNNALWIWGIAFLAGLIHFGWRAVAQDQFLDGLVYAAVSRNYALGLGDSWSPHFTGHAFSGHPTLFFGLEALFFRLLGDHWWTDRVFCLVIWLAGFWGLHKVAKHLSASPVAELIWVVFPLVGWAYPQNMLDSLVATWLIWAAYALLQRQFWLSGILLFLALLTKGPFALFALFLPLFLVKEGKWKGFLLQNGILVALLAILYVWDSGFRSFLSLYWSDQILGSVSGRGEHFDFADRFVPLIQLLLHLAIGLALIGVLLLLARQKPVFRKPHWRFLLIALIAIIPLLISAKQRSFYIVPALPFLALFLAESAPPVHLPKVRLFIPVLLTILLGTTIVLRFQSHTKYRKYATLAKQIPPGREKIRLTGALQQNWYLHAYLQRYRQTEFEMNAENCGCLMGIQLKSEPLDTTGGWTISGETEDFYLLRFSGSISDSK